MHSQDTINQFIELRSQNISVDRISEKLKIGKTTAFDWTIKYKDDIAKLRALALEAIQERHLATYEQDLAFTAGQLHRVREELAKRDLEFISTEFLYNQEAALDSRLRKKCVLPAFTPQEPAQDRDSRPIGIASALNPSSQFTPNQ